MQVYSETFQVYGRLEILPQNIAINKGDVAALIHWEDQDQTGLATAQDLLDLEQGVCAWMRKA